MKLTQPEIIQILRRRRDLNQGNFGAQAFNTSFESGRTKIKNIELGRQRPTDADLEKMANVLKVPVATLNPSGVSRGKDDGRMTTATGEICLHARTLAFFPGLAPYLEMLNQAVTVNDEELIDHISDKIAQLLKCRVKTAPTEPKILTSGQE